MSETGFHETHKYCWRDADDEGNYWNVSIHICTVHTCLLKFVHNIEHQKRKKKNEDVAQYAGSIQ